MRALRSMLLAGAAVLTSVAAAPADAQTSASGEQPGAAAEATGEAETSSADDKRATENAEVPASGLSDVDADEIVVTGTRIVRPNMESNAPITVVDEAFLRQRGLARIEDALSQIPQVTPMLGLQGNNWDSGRAGVNLRRLGQGRTLTLLNGLRIQRVRRRSVRTAQREHHAALHLRAMLDRDDPGAI